MDAAIYQHGFVPAMGRPPSHHHPLDRHNHPPHHHHHLQSQPQLLPQLLPSQPPPAQHLYHHIPQIHSQLPPHLRPHANFIRRKPPAPFARDRDQNPRSDNDAPTQPVAHTLTACCRCRQRKTRCDPTLPRCLPCERSGSACEYFDTAKGIKINRSYVVKLQQKVRRLEAELSQYCDDDDDEHPRTNEDMVRPGGMIRLSESEETARYLGPSSGIAMIRLLMEGAKRFTDSKSIAEFIPEVRARRMERMNRMQSISGPAPRKKSYPMVSAHPAQSLPKRAIADKLVDVFCQRAQILHPTLHETALTYDVDAVFAGDLDPYKNFVVRMVLAISLQKLDTQYAGLAHSYYLAAMQTFEDVIRPKDLKTLQCLILIGQYSQLTPIRTPIYFVIGLATRICQQLGLCDEKTITSAHLMGLENPKMLDMRRRLFWIIASMELGLAHSMGRPSGLGKASNLIDVQFFETVADEFITEDGIASAPPSEKKLVAFHFCKMRLCEEEICRILYEKKRLEPRQHDHPWFTQMEQKLKDWLDATPPKPEWIKPWFVGRYHTLIVMLLRPSPQVPKPSAQAALRCFEASDCVIKISHKQVLQSAIDITWIFLLTLHLALNAILWSVSYPEVRTKHAREDVEELVNVALDILDQCAERWPGTAATLQLYSALAKACLQSYDAKEPPGPLDLPGMRSPVSSEGAHPPTLLNGAASSAAPPPPGPPSLFFNHPQYGYAADSAGQELFSQFAFSPDNTPYFVPSASPFRSTSFRSNSIFHSPGSTNAAARRPSHFAPDQPPLYDADQAPAQPPPLPPVTTTTAVAQNGQASPPTSNHSQAGFAYNGSVPPPVALTRAPEMAPLKLAEAVIAPSASVNSMLSPALTPTATSTGSPMSAMSSREGQLPPPPLVALKFEVSDPAMSPLLPYSMAPAHQAPPAMQQQQQQHDAADVPPPAPTRLAGLTAPSLHPDVALRNMPPTTGANWFEPQSPGMLPYTPASTLGGGPASWTDGLTSHPASAFAGLGLSVDAYAMGPSGASNGVTGPTAPSRPGLSANGSAGPDGRLMPPSASQMYGGTYGGGGGGPDGSLNSAFAYSNQRHGSLNQAQQMELMDVLETQGVGEIDAFLSMDMNMNMGNALGEGGMPWR